ncbi:hypothetical protein FH972_020807 [Carpinus fangiana]|uniref:RING-type E3 ubiquitin transferase n=1 Tax=Carpinus fangiana TaxID=176857 RepID=A0A5N6RUC0_9ROSI|nr:hypothetical protein FH972_020807 [Carpinus fangiana]
MGEFAVTKSSLNVKEEGLLDRLRVFNWNERLRKIGGEPSDLSDTQGLFFFLITENFTIRIPGEGVVYASQRRTNKVVPFEHRQLLSRDSTEMVSRGAVSGTKEFLPETVQPLGAEIWDWLVLRYRFSPDRLQRPVPPRIVIVVEVSLNKSAEYCSREEMVRKGGNLFPPRKPRPSRNDDWQRTEPFDIELAQNDPSLFYTREIQSFLSELTYLLEVRNAFPTLPITNDDPLGFVQVPAEFALELETFEFEQAHDATCAICLERLSSTGKATELARTLCSHFFHMRCITRWLHKKPSCPMCRFELF